MPWLEVSVVSLREEFCVLAEGRGVSMRALCRRFGISRKTGYKWLQRYRAAGVAGLTDRARRPRTSPWQTAAEIERQVLELRDAHPAWGGRKLRAWLQAHGHRQVPAASTITAILRRNERLHPEQAARQRAFRRFEQERPNALWQMDFKGHFATAAGRCHPLTVLDDHSRFALGLQACADERHATVQERLVKIFERYGLPERMLSDNGPPWGAGQLTEHTRLTVWLMRLGVRITHGRPYHPQTQGKDERFHRTLQAEVIRYERFRDIGHCQQVFDRWRDVYNLERPHQALGLLPPASRYQPSSRSYPATLPAIEYGPDDTVRRVRPNGQIRYQGRSYRVGAAFAKLPVAVRPRAEAGQFSVHFCQQALGGIDLRLADEGQVQTLLPLQTHPGQQPESAHVDY